MLRVVAVAPGDGWAFVEDGGRLFLVRPPFTTASKAEVSDAVVARAISEHGFSATERQFGSWGELIGFLEEGIISHAAPALSRFERLQRMLPHATAEVIDGYLDRIESELLPQGQWRPARMLLEQVLALDSVTTRPTLLKRAVGLLGECTTAETTAMGAREDLVHDPDLLAERVPLAAAKYGATALARYLRGIAPG